MKMKHCRIMLGLIVCAALFAGVAQAQNIDASNGEDEGISSEMFGKKTQVEPLEDYFKPQYGSEFTVADIGGWAAFNPLAKPFNAALGRDKREFWAVPDNGLFVRGGSFHACDHILQIGSRWLSRHGYTVVALTSDSAEVKVGRDRWRGAVLERTEEHATGQGRAMSRKEIQDEILAPLQARLILREKERQAAAAKANEERVRGIINQFPNPDKLAFD